uniref:Uncharacterized protein n=1 Tax=Rangifer tarandus platyrhynchus TaxID=3082113 RepID=A0ACB0F4X7_RANTA|nr:unnamed protein product [Rangifer tarandus platyrhynchus]
MSVASAAPEGETAGAESRARAASGHWRRPPPPTVNPAGLAPPRPTAERRGASGRGGCRDRPKMAERLGSVPAFGPESHSLLRC